MADLVSLPTSPDPAWLSAALRAGGALPRGEVLGVAVRDNPAFNSRVRHLTLGYSADAPGDAPRVLLLKTLANGDGAHEVGWYQYLAERGIRLPMLATCHLALADPASGESALLLADLSTTHEPPVSRKALLALDGVPTRADLEAMMPPWPSSTPPSGSTSTLALAPSSSPCGPGTATRSTSPATSSGAGASGRPSRRPRPTGCLPASSLSTARPWPSSRGSGRPAWASG